jgi:hypothetical protein
MTIGYFQLYTDPMFGTCIAIASKDFWEHEECLDGDGLDEDTEAALPDGLYELTESMYEHTFDTDDAAKQALLSAGFVEKELLTLD